MADVNIVGKVSIQTTDAADQVLKLKTRVSDLKEAFNSAEKGSDAQKNALIELTKAQQDLSTANGKLNASLNENGGSFSILKDKIQGMVPGLKSAESGAISFGTQLKALAANPFILILTGIVIALKVLYDAFTYTVEGGKKMEQMLAGIKAVIDVLIERWLTAAGAVLKFWTGDWKGAANDMKEAFSGIGDSVKKAYTEVSKATAALQALTKAERESSVQRAQQNAAIVKSKELLNDENATIGEKKKALAEVSAFEKKIGEEDVARAKEKLELKKVIWGQEKEGLKKHAQDIADLEIDIANKSEETARKDIQIQRQFRSLNRQEKQKETEEAKAAKEKEKAEKENYLAYTEKDAKLRMEANLALMKDGAEKEIQIVNNKLADEKAANQIALEDGKITKAQLATLNADGQRLAEIEVGNINKKYRDKEKEETRKFEEDLAKMQLDIKLAAITDAREKERAQLDKTFEERFKQAADKYKGNEERLKQVQAIIMQEQELAKKTLEKKFADEDMKQTQELTLKKIAFQMKAAKDDFNLQRSLLDQKTSIIKAQYQQEISVAGLTATKKAEIEEKYTEELAEQTEARKAIAKAEADFRTKAAENISTTLEKASEAFGKSTLAGKVAAIAAATISTFTSAQKAYEATVGIPVVGPVLAPINAGLAIATGLENIKQISQVQVPGGGSGGNIPNVSSPVSPQPQLTSTSLNASSIQGVGNAAAGGTGRVFVLDRDIKDNSEREATLTRRARLG